MTATKLQWRKLGTDDYATVCGRFRIVRMAACYNRYVDRDQWTLIDVATNDGIDVFDRLCDTKEAAQRIVDAE